MTTPIPGASALVPARIDTALRNRDHAGLQSLIAYLRTLPDDERATAQFQLLASAEQAVAQMQESMIDVVEWVEEDPCWEGAHATDPQRLAAIFPQLAKAAKAGKKARDNRQSYRKKIEGTWGAPEGQVYDDILAGSENRLRRLAELTKWCKTKAEAQQRASEAMLTRLSTSGKGIRAVREYTAGDFDAAGEAAQRQKAMMHVAALATKARNAGFLLHEGWLYPQEAGRAKTVEVQPSSPRQSIEGGGRAPGGTPTLSLPTRPHTRQAERELRSAYLASQIARGSKTPTPSPSGPPARPSKPFTPVRPSPLGRPAPQGRTPAQAQPPSTPAFSQASTPTQPPSQATIHSPFVSPAPEVATTAARSIACLCNKNAADGKLLHFLETDEDQPSPRMLVGLLRAFGKSVSSEKDTQTYCYRHVGKLAAAAGMKRSQHHVDLVWRLTHMARNGLRDVEAYKTRSDTYTWFRKEERGAVPADELGPYRFFPTRPTLFYDIQGQTRIQDCIVDALGIRSLGKAWVERGTINTPAIFDYWGPGKGDIGRLVDGEFDMYAFHLREINDKANKGWQRNQLYSLSQQLMRQDIGYWLAYMALRPDRAGWLISYPYYTKSQSAKDKTGFKHIDLNIPGMAEEGRGTSQIQGSLSLTDESVNDCTIVVPKMHTHLKTWHERLVRRGGLKGGFVHKIDETILTAQDLQDFGTGWEPVPCKRFEVRISRPELPHGAQGPAKGIRRTMLPWLVRIDRNHHGLEVAEAGTWEELSTAHRMQTAPPRSPSGHANVYGTIPWKFPAAIQLEGLGPISDALVGRKKWTDPEVQYEAARLLTLPVDQMRAYLESWRANAIQAFKKGMERTQVLERYYFPKEKSYCNPQRVGQPKADFARADIEDIVEGGTIELEG